MPMFPWQGTRTIPQSAVFHLTPLGRQKAEEYGGDPRSRVLVALETNGASNVEEIANYAHLRKGQVERILPVLMRGGYVHPIRGGDED